MTRLPVRSVAGLLLALLLAACSAPLPTTTPVPPTLAGTEAPATPTPRATATALPTLTATPRPTTQPAPTITPTPAAGYFRQPEQGFWFHYPEDWLVEETGGDLPSVIVRDNNDPVRLLAGARSLEESTTLDDLAEQIGRELGLAESVELLESSEARTGDGTDALGLQLAWEDADGLAMRAQGIVALANGRGYALLLVARPEVLSARPQTVESIAATFHLDQPEYYGISRGSALVLLAEEPATLDPLAADDGPGGLASHLFSGLLRLDADLSPVADLAASWEVSADGARYTFHLESGAAFHDGTPVSATDVQLSWERALSPDGNLEAAGWLLGDIQGAAERRSGAAEHISGVSVLDETTLEVQLVAARPTFLAKLTQPATFVTPGGEPVDQDAIGSGPFLLDRWLPGEALILKRNADFYRDPPAVEAVIYLLGSGSQFLAYEAGLIDVAQVDSRNLARAQDPADPLSAELSSGNSFCTTLVTFDSSRPPFNELAVRRAFALAVNRDQLATVVLRDAATPASGLLPPGMPGYLDRPLAGGFAPQEAKELLAGLDLPTLTLAVPDSGELVALAEALTAGWSEALGVSVTTQVLDAAGFSQQVAENPANLILEQRCAGYPDPELFLDRPFHSDSPANLGGFGDPEVDGLLEAARQELEPDARLALIQAAEDALLAQQPAVPLLDGQWHLLVRPRVQKMQPGPINVLWPALISLEE